MSEKLGTSDLKLVLAVPMALGEAIECYADGKLDAEDAAKTMLLVQTAISSLPAWKGALPEFQDLDQAEKDELHAWAAADFDIKDDKVEEWLEMGLKVVLMLSDLSNLLKKE